MKYLILVFLITPTLLFSQTWEKTYGGESWDEGLSVQQTTDDGYIITGYTGLFGSGFESVYIIKTDEYGDTLWTKTYGGEDSDRGYSGQQTTDGGYIITGITESFGNGGEDVYLIKTDENGDTLWTRTYGGEGLDGGLSVQQTNDFGYIITGFTMSSGNGEEDVYLIKTDSDGDTLWTKTFGGEDRDFGQTVQQTSDGGYFVTGWTSSNGPIDYDIYLIKTDENGDTIWTKTIGEEVTREVGLSGQQTTDGGYILTGDKGPNGSEFIDVYLIKTDNNGEILWTRTYGKKVQQQGRSVQQTTDGGYIITGHTGYFEPNYQDVYLIKTDENGDTLWTNTFGEENKNWGNFVQQTTDGGYIITGVTIGTNSLDVYLIKTDENGIVTSSIEFPNPTPKRKLLKTIDLSGKEISKLIKNQPYIEIYDDGTTEKKMKIE